MAYTTVTEELAIQYPSLKEKVGKTIKVSELRSAQADANYEEKKVSKNKKVETTEPTNGDATSPANAPKVPVAPKVAKVNKTPKTK